MTYDPMTSGRQQYDQISFTRRGNKLSYVSLAMYIQGYSGEKVSILGGKNL
jgi:hypothetical protein